MKAGRFRPQSTDGISRKVMFVEIRKTTGKQNRKTETTETNS
jgi:hypothetical protein